LILMVADRVVVLTQSMLDQMSRIEQWAARKKTDIIPFGTRLTTPSAADIENFRRQFGLDERWPVLCTVGVFFHDWKVRGQELLIEAVARLRSDFPNILLVIVGDGQYRGRLERRIKENGLDPHVRITGYLPNAYAALACTDVYTHMALREAQGVAIVEAMLAGNPLSQPTAEASRRSRRMARPPCWWNPPRRRWNRRCAAC
jgi:1,2-diacylglycerol 3-alpha-glucosyltransferase